MTTEEIRLAKNWFIQDDESPKDIAERLGRYKSTITRLLVKRTPRKQRGPKAHALKRFAACISNRAFARPPLATNLLPPFTHLRSGAVFQALLNNENVDKLVYKLIPGYVKPSKTLKYNSGARGVKVLAGVGGGKVLVWSAIDGQWNGDVAAKMYTGPVRRAWQNAFPNKRRFVVLEDNDPSGFKSGKSKGGKAEACARTAVVGARGQESGHRFRKVLSHANHVVGSGRFRLAFSCNHICFCFPGQDR